MRVGASCLTQNKRCATYNQPDHKYDDNMNGTDNNKQSKQTGIPRTLFFRRKSSSASMLSPRTAPCPPLLADPPRLRPRPCGPAFPSLLAPAVWLLLLLLLAPPAASAIDSHEQYGRRRAMSLPLLVLLLPSLPSRVSLPKREEFAVESSTGGRAVSWRQCQLRDLLRVRPLPSGSGGPAPAPTSLAVVDPKKLVAVAVDMVL